MEQLLAQLAQWDNYQRLARDVGRLKREQENVCGRTRQLRAETLTRQLGDLTAQQRAGLKRLSERQNDLALRCATLTSSMEATRQELSEADPSAATILAHALDAMRQAALDGTMRNVAREIDRNRLGQAAAGQEVVIDLLGNCEELLANRPQQQLDRRVEELRRAAARVDEICSRQEPIARETRAGTAADTQQFQRWQREEAELAQDVEQLSRQLLGSGGDAAESALRAAATRICRVPVKRRPPVMLPRTRQQAQDAQDALTEARRQLQESLGTVEAQMRELRMANCTRVSRSFFHDSSGCATRRRRLREPAAAEWRTAGRLAAGGASDGARATGIEPGRDTVGRGSGGGGRLRRRSPADGSQHDRRRTAFAGSGHGVGNHPLSATSPGHARPGPDGLGGRPTAVAAGNARGRAAARSG